MEATRTLENMTIEELEDFILERLPRVLERDPRFVTFIEGIIAERYPRRDEFAALLNEFREFRAETTGRFNQVDERFNQVDERFNQVDERFNQVDERFDQVDVRFNQVDERFNQVDERFERVDERFNQVDERFERVDERFNQVDERFERVEQRLDNIEHRLDRHDEKFDALDRRFDGVDQRIDNLEQRMEQGFHDLHVAIDRLGARWGIRNESIFRQTMREILEQSFGATVEERYIDGEQFDCVIIDSAHILVEISASVGRDILKKLQRKRQLYIDATGVTPARVLLAVGSIHSKRANALREAGFEVIEPETDEEA